MVFPFNNQDCNGSCPGDDGGAGYGYGHELDQCNNCNWPEDFVCSEDLRAFEHFWASSTWFKFQALSIHNFQGKSVLP